jgi:hypothetical protein
MFQVVRGRPPTEVGRKAVKLTGNALSVEAETNDAVRKSPSGKLQG